MKIKIVLLALLSFHHMARAQWASFASGSTNGTVVDFALHNDELYAVGLFTTINGNGAKGVARWDGTAWQAVGDGFTDGCHSLVTIDSVLYLTRYEMQVDSNWVYSLNNADWEKLGSGFYLEGANSGQFYTCSIYDVIEYNGDIYASGEFNRNGGQVVNGIAKWDGTDWSPLGEGLTDPIFGQVIYPHQMLVFNGQLLVCGNFSTAGGTAVNGVAVWDGGAWSALGEGFNSTVYALGVFNGELYAGGDFSQSGTTALAAVAKWDGSKWVSPGFGFQYTNPNAYLFVHTIQAIEGKLYLAGGFDRVVPDNGSATAVGSIIEYDGLSIHTLEGGANNDVEGLIGYDGKLLVGGFFSIVGNGLAASKLAIYGAPSAVNETEKAPDASLVFPNPTNGVVDVQQFTDGMPMPYKLFNVNGDLMQYGYASQILDFTGLGSGVYCLEIGIKNEKKRIMVAKN